jgi:ABC-type glycerol-3-phosphate transport system substrate-binding protein
MTNLFPNGIGEVNCQGVNLVVATQTGPQIASPMENHWKEWGAKTGGTVEVQTFPFGDLFEKIRTGYVSGASPFDIVVYASDWAGDLMGAGYLLEVPQKNQDQMGYKYLLPTYRDRILSWGGKVYGTPYDGDDHITYFRKDLLTDPTYMADFKAKYGYDIPVPIKTWDQYYDIAESSTAKRSTARRSMGLARPSSGKRSPTGRSWAWQPRSPSHPVTRPTSSIRTRWSRVSIIPALWQRWICTSPWRRLVLPMWSTGT